MAVGVLILARPAQMFSETTLPQRPPLGVESTVSRLQPAAVRQRYRETFTPHKVSDCLSPLLL